MVDVLIYLGDHYWSSLAYIYLLWVMAFMLKVM